MRIVEPLSPYQFSVSCNGEKFEKHRLYILNLLSANFTKWSNTFKQFVGKLPTNCLSVFDHFVGLALKGLINDFAVFKNCGGKLLLCEDVVRNHGFERGNLSAKQTLHKK